jgi:hypothetical protein
VWVGAVVFWSALVEPAWAGGGRGEINQACALAGCFPGDAPGFPVTLVGDGSYVLTGNLRVADPNQSAITVSGPIQGGIRIDLNGFEVAGPVVCSGVGSAVACTPAGSGIGISSSVSYAAVVGGTVRGFGAGGVRLIGSPSRVERVTAQANGGFGIRGAGWSIVSQSIARQNGGIGIEVTAGSVVEGCTAADNRLQGIALSGHGAVVTGSTVFFNGHDGIGTQTGAVVRGNTAYLNALAGIAVAGGSLVVDNVSYDNSGNGVWGEAAGSLISRNTVRFNEGYGLFLNTTTTFRENNLTINGLGPVLGGTNMGDNACNGAICP